ncbi:MAG: hypothetical protein ACREJ2_16460, partial [Planctomycetota bacterium]
GEPPRSAPRWLGIAPVAKGADWLRQLRTRRSIRSSLTLSDGNAAGARPAGSASAGDAGIVAAAAPDAAGGEDFDGFVFGAAMLADLERLDLQRDLRPSRGVLIQAGAARTLSRESTVLGGAPRRLTLQAVRQEPFWERGEAVDITPLAEALLAALEADATSAQ